MLISYDFQNLNHLYHTINSSLKCYISQLHSRIPPRIVPLIWNDPVMQKLAMVISSSKNFKQQQKTEKKFRQATQKSGICSTEPKLDVPNPLNTQKTNLHLKK